MDPTEVHPSRDELCAYWKNRLGSDERGRVGEHLAKCEFCAEIIADLTALTEAEAEITQLPISAQTERKMHQLYRRLFPGQVVALDGREEIPRTAYHLAADGKQTARPTVENLATVFSSDPEIVLKIMRDNRANRTYLHLIADNTALTSHVLVESPESRRSYVTDVAGHAEIGDDAGFDAASTKWRVRLPEAEFPLVPLEIESDRATYQKAMILETERGDRVQLTLEERAGSRQIKVEVLSLEGHPPSDPLTAAISFGSITDTKHGLGAAPVYFRVEQLPTSIQLRLYK